jgi:hypothetical protein
MYWVNVVLALKRIIAVIFWKGWVLPNSEQYTLLLRDMFAAYILPGAC